MRGNTAAVITMVTWADTPLTGLTTGTAGGMGTADNIILICSPTAVNCMVTYTAAGWSILPLASVQTQR